MKNKPLIVLSIALLTILISIACMLFSPTGGTLKFEPDRLPDAQANVTYETQIHVTQNHTPVGDFAICKGALPAGLDLKKVDRVEETARISGMPQETGTFRFTVSVWRYGTNVSGQTGEKEYSLVVTKKT